VLKKVRSVRTLNNACLLGEEAYDTIQREVFMRKEIEKKIMESLVHRDDVDISVLESMQEAHPDQKIVCAGDIPKSQIPEEVIDGIKEMAHDIEVSMVGGVCVECGAAIENYDQKACFDSPPPGWSLYQIGDGSIGHWICNACEVSLE
jgi:hypothetical protein